MSGLHIQVAKVPLLPSAVFLSSGTGHTPNILAVHDGWLGIPLGDRFPSYSVEPEQGLGSHIFGCLCLELLWGQTRITEP